jgi:hypothetical protein
LQLVRVWVALGAASATRQSFLRLSQIDRLIVRLIIIFKICRFSNALFLNLGAKSTASGGPARLGVNLQKDASPSLAF